MGQFTTGTAVLSYLGVQATTPPQLISAGRAPKSTDTAFTVGTFWLYSDPTAPNNFLYQLIKMVASPGANPVASWVQIYPAMSGPGTDFFLADNAVSATFNTSSTLTLSGDGTNTNTYATTFGVAFQLNPSIHLTGSVTADTGLIAQGGDIIAETGDVIVTDGDVTVTAGNILLHNTNAAGDEGVIEFGGSPFINNIGTSNTFVGENAGNLSLTTASAENETGIGQNALNALTTGASNTALGAGAGELLTTGSYNTFLGTSAGDALLTGSDNILVGVSAGANYVAAESSNVLINHVGVASETNIIRIGTSGSSAGQQNKAFIAGTYGVTPGGTINVAYVDSNGQLGSVATLPIAYGGTNATSMTNTDGIIYYDGTRLVSLANGTTGQVLTATTSAAPSWGNGGGGGGVTWTVTTVDANMVINNGYIANKAGLLTMTLPATAAAGTMLGITGMNAGHGWKIAQNASQQIFFATAATTAGTGGSLASTNTQDTVQLLCIVANTSWNVISSVGNITVV